MKSLITKYDDIFLNQSRLCNLIDKLNPANDLEKLDALGKLIAGYIFFRHCNSPDYSPKIIRIILVETIETEILANIMEELSVENKSTYTIQHENRHTYISLY